jgi:hypothetical protein
MWRKLIVVIVGLVAAVIFLLVAARVGCALNQQCADLRKRLRQHPSTIQNGDQVGAWLRADYGISPPQYAPSDKIDAFRYPDCANSDFAPHFVSINAGLSDVPRSHWVSGTPISCGDKHGPPRISFSCFGVRSDCEYWANGNVFAYKGPK